MAKGWTNEQVIRHYQLKVVREPSPEMMLVTHCGAGKEGDFGSPEHLYTSNRIKRLITNARRREISWGIISDKYGLVLSTDIVETYDIHPKDLSELKLKMIGSAIAHKCQKYRIRGLTYYPSMPLKRCLPYLKMLDQMRNHGVEVELWLSTGRF